jgi:type I restriction enzyme S subunit
MVKVNCVCTTPERWSGSDSSALEIRYVDIGGVDRLDRRIASASTLLAADAPSRAQWVLNEGDVLVATVRPNLNAVCRIPPEFAGAIGSNGFAALRPNAALLDSWYLYFWTRSPSFIDMLVRRATGAAYPAVSLADVESLQIPLPPLDEQRRIADILDAADALRRKRREALRLLDELQRATFLEMFGDPVTNPKGWPEVRLGHHREHRERE